MNMQDVPLEQIELKAARVWYMYLCWLDGDRHAGDLPDPKGRSYAVKMTFARHAATRDTELEVCCTFMDCKRRDGCCCGGGAAHSVFSSAIISSAIS
jgi:hypothetical protein